jgi:DNA-binding NarL/FixJ family response regulator
MMDSITISIVEDIEEIRNSLQKIFSQSSDCLLLSSYFNAEDALLELPGLQPDIVIMDINLPGMSGIECIRQIREKCPKTQFMMFTIYEDSEQVFEALTAGASGYLLKNTKPEKIIEAIKELYAGGAPMTTGIARRVVHSFQKQNLPADERAKLSVRENEVLSLLAKGLLYKEIAQKLRISFGTVRQHIHNIYEKLHVQNKTEAINKAFGNRQ